MYINIYNKPCSSQNELSFLQQCFPEAKIKLLLQRPHKSISAKCWYYLHVVCMLVCVLFNYFLLLGVEELIVMDRIFEILTLQPQKFFAVSQSFKTVTVNVKRSSFRIHLLHFSGV